MTKTFVLALAICGFGGWMAYGQDAASPKDSARTKLAEQLVEEMNVQETVEKTMSMIKKMIPYQIEQMRKHVSVKEQDEAAAKKRQERLDKSMVKMVDMISAEMGWDAMKDQYVALYAETFSETELKGLIEFYKSPVGRAFVQKQPELMERSMKLSQQKMMQLMPKIQAFCKEAATEEAQQEKSEQAAPAKPSKKAVE
ncbi:MAG: DUF2059 domain-containing protein [Thermoguttaceae bacterium]